MFRLLFQAVGRADASRLMMLLVVAVVMVPLLQACQGANPVAVAETPEQKAYALYGMYVVFNEEAAAIAENPAIPPSVRLGVIRAAEAAKPSADALEAATNNFIEIAGQVAAGTTPQEKYVIALNNMNQWVTDSRPLIDALVAAVKGARK